MILAGDIGGTHSRIALFRQDGGRLVPEREEVYYSSKHSGLGQIVSSFLKDSHTRIAGAAFGIAGPVLHGRASVSNLPWVVDGTELAHMSGIRPLWLINDLQAHASGIGDLEPADFVTLNSAAPATGNGALIAAGTGLGEAGLYWDGVRHHAFACEGGHTDFAPSNDLEIALHKYLQGKYGHVSYEPVLSGPGLKNIYDFLRDSGREDEPSWLQDELARAADPAALISEHALRGRTSICEHCLDIFACIYGAETGNLALKLMAVSGVFLSGGIAARILPLLQRSLFMQRFAAKGRMQPLLEKIPVKVITNDRVGLIGAARYALSRQNNGV